jgi:hypothetical protein
MAEEQQISKGRLWLGAAILIIGFLSPLLIPLVTQTDWSIGLKTTISGLLAFGIPEIFMLIAVAVMGKAGYEYIKDIALKYLKRFAPPDKVSVTRFRIGIIMFSTPLLYGWLQPYLGHYFTVLNDLPLWQYIIGDTIFILSFFVLGGSFWDKLSGLFKYSN